MSNRASGRDTSFLARRGLVCGFVDGGFRAVFFADAVFTATDFSLAGLVFVRERFVFAGEVFLLAALGSAGLEVVFAAGAEPLATSCAARASLRWRLLR